MEDFSINEMQKMQRALQEKYKDKWEPIGPETGKNKLLWMVGKIEEGLTGITGFWRMEVNYGLQRGMESSRMEG